MCLGSLIEVGEALFLPETNSRYTLDTNIKKFDDPCSEQSLRYYINLYFETVENGNKLLYHEAKTVMDGLNELDLVEKCGSQFTEIYKQIKSARELEHTAW